MVYLGKPSTACLQCRKRKLRCDRRKKACGQCIRANLTCSGYRHVDQLRIRDESHATAQKALARRFKTVPKTLAIGLDVRARNAFFSHYVAGFAKTYDVLESLYQQSSSDGHLTASVDAVSLAFFSFQSSSTRSLPMAGEKYLSALPLVNTALRAPESTTSDSTLLAVLLLDLFEKITNKNPRSFDSWMSHVNGGLALVRSRDSNQFITYTRLRLSIRLSLNLLISCCAANASVPPALVQLRSDLEPFLDTNDPKWRISGLVVKYTNLRGDIQDGQLSNSDIISNALDLDEEFKALALAMPSTWLYSTTHLGEFSPRLYEQHFDTYPDHHVAQSWNVLRVMRILLNDIIRMYCIQGASPFDQVASISSISDNATETIESMAKEICATVPQYTMDTKKITDTTGRSEIQRLRCYTLPFPLYVAGMYASPATRMQPWVIEQLRFMSDVIGLRNANLVADVLERNDGTSPWSVYAMLGSYAFAA